MTYPSLRVGPKHIPAVEVEVHGFQEQFLSHNLIGTLLFDCQAKINEGGGVSKTEKKGATLHGTHNIKCFTIIVKYILHVM